MQYHVAQNGIQSGPISESEVLAKLQSGALSATDLCWAEGMTVWQPIGAKFSTPTAFPAPAAVEINPYAPPVANLIRPGNRIDELGYHPGFWWRFLARFVDGIIISVAFYFMSLIISVVGGSMAESEIGIMILGLVFLVAMVSCGWLYHSLMETSTYQGSVGKIICGIKVTDMNGQRISFGRATGRYFGKILSSLLLCIGYLMCIWTEQKQCLHDRMSGCLLFRKG